MREKLVLTARVLPEGRPFEVRGGIAWALRELHRAGPLGCTPIDNPGPRWAAYVHRLREECGLAIETVYESRKDRFPALMAATFCIALWRLSLMTLEQRQRPEAGKSRNAENPSD